MATYIINKGIGRKVEFKGLQSQYLVLFALGLLGVFFLFIILFLAGINEWFCIAFGLVSASVLVWVTFRLNRMYGTHGLMKRFANRQHPRFITSRKAIFRLINTKTKQP